MQNNLIKTHAKLLGFIFNNITPLPFDSSLFSANPIPFPSPISRAEIVGYITSRDFKPNKFVWFTIDNGTGTIPCILWLNQINSPYYSNRNQNDIQQFAEIATSLASLVQIGIVARVRGKISKFRTILQINVTDVAVERDPNSEILHWLQCLKLAQKCYHIFDSKKISKQNTCCIFTILLFCI